MNYKGIASIGVLIGLLVFLMLLFVAAMPIVSNNINSVSATMLPLANGAATNSVLITLPLFMALGAVAMVAFGLLSG